LRGIFATILDINGIVAKKKIWYVDVINPTGEKEEIEPSEEQSDNNNRG